MKPNRWPVGTWEHHSLRQKEGAYTETVCRQLRMPCSVFLRTKGGFGDTLNVDLGSCNTCPAPHYSRGLRCGATDTRPAA